MKVFPTPIATSARTLAWTKFLAKGAIAAALLIVLVASCNRTKTAKDYVHDAGAHRAAGDLAAALIDLKSALQSDPRDISVRVLLARAYLEVPDPASAEAELLRAGQDGGNPAEIAKPLAEAELMLGEPEAVLRHTEQIEAASPSLKASLMAERAEALMALGRMDEATRTLDLALGDDARSVDVLAAMVRRALTLHDLPTARMRLAQAKANDPENFTLFSLEGAVTFAAGDFGASEQAFRRMYLAAPWNLNARLGMARAEIAADRLDEAEANLAVVLRAAATDVNANYLNALVSYRRRDFVKAQWAAQRVLAVAKNFAPALLIAGASSLSLRQFEQARVYLAQYIYLVPDNLQARKLLASVQIELGRADDALKVLAPVAAQDSDDAQALALAGIASERTGDLTAADRYFQMALHHHPDSADLRLQLAMTELALGRVDAGINELERAVKDDPNSLRPEALLFIIYLRSGETEKALEIGQRLQKTPGTEAVGCALAALALFAKGDNEAARATLETARQLRRGDALTFRLLARIAALDEDRDSARAYLRGIVDADPKDVQAYVDLAELEIRDDRLDDAAVVLKAATKAIPNDAAVRVMLGRVLLIDGRHREALSVVEPVLAQGKQYPSLLEVAGQAQLGLNDAEAATATFKTLVDAQPESSRAHRYLAAAYAGARRIEPALDEARRAVELDPDDVSPRDFLARLYLAQRRFVEAQVLAGKLMAARPQDPTVAALMGDIAWGENRPQDAVAAYRRATALGASGLTRIRLARAQAQLGQSDAAEQTLLPWLAAHPEDAAARLSLGDIYLGAHRLDDAMSQYSAVPEKDRRGAAAENNLAWILSLKGRSAEALEHARHAADLAPDVPEVLDTLGVVLLQNQRPAEAVSALATAAAATPADPEVQFHFAQALAGTGDTIKARRVLQSLLAADHPFVSRSAAEELFGSLGAEPHPMTGK